MRMDTANEVCDDAWYVYSISRKAGNSLLSMVRTCIMTGWYRHVSTVQAIPRQICARYRMRTRMCRYHIASYKLGTMPAKLQTALKAMQATREMLCLLLNVTSPSIPFQPDTDWFVQTPADLLDRI